MTYTKRNWIEDAHHYVNKTGRYIQGVLGSYGFDDDFSPQFYYTVGNSSIEGSYPLEFLLFWHTGSMAGHINLIGDYLSKRPDLCRQIDAGSGAEFKRIVGGNADLSLAARPLTGVLKEIALDRYCCGLTNPVLNGDGTVVPFSLWQFLVPDLSGRFAGQEGFDDRLVDHCPLSLPEGWSPDVVIDFGDPEVRQAALDSSRTGRPRRPGRGFGNS